ncbi:cupin domain-containing protein [Blastococcus sp. VKM Ac-2987]|uniref:cupin domain-containing protein n=1 Tax=Blastococcus sp. VKM Ac-2987 TaxID=3004141 RepID=UPI0022ABBCC8|nr:cupin domain-containing protein [Blastococcus sp. VKM Ac-2987]MCZ2859975.1 cupin domain-containing protein [Blastococcus sp. VKM Ac-2987]
MPSEEDQVMVSIESKNMDRPDESRTPEKTRMDVVHLGDATVARYTLQPGWRWSDCLKPLVGTDSCQAAHLGFVISGRIHIKADDGAETDLGAGDTYRLEPGHDAWVVGDEPLLGLEFESETAETFAKA